MFLPSFTSTTVPGDDPAPVAKSGESPHPTDTVQYHRASRTSIPSIGSSVRDELFSAATNAPITPLTTDYFYFNPIYHKRKV